MKKQIFLEMNKSFDSELYNRHFIEVRNKFSYFDILKFKYFFVNSDTKKMLLNKGFDKFRIFDNDIQENINIYLKSNLERLKNFDFTIISDDCWAGYIYKYLEIPYKSPTIWLSFVHDNYYKFCNNLEHYFNYKLKFLDSNTTPIAMLDDVKISFNHCKTNEEAMEKWERRIERINPNNLFLKVTMHSKEEIELFKKLKFKNKIGFIDRDILPETDIKEIILLKNDKKYKAIWQIAQLQCYKYFDIIEWLNRGEIIKFQ